MINHFLYKNAGMHLNWVLQFLADIVSNNQY